MTIHISQKPQKCDKCGKPYLPFPEYKYLCPNCFTRNEPLYNFTELAAESIKYNISRWGTVLPAAWLSTGTSDETLIMICKMIHIFKEQSHSDFEIFSKEIIKTLILTDQDEYLRDHIRIAGVAVYNIVYDKYGQVDLPEEMEYL